MPSDLWKQIKQALIKAMSLEGQARADFINRLECQSSELAAEVRELIDASEVAEEEQFLGFTAKLGELDDTVVFNHQPPNSTYDTIPPSPEKERKGPSSIPTDSINPSLSVSEDFEINELLGQGGMGVVYKAYQHSLRRHVALKIIPERLMRTPEAVARFQIEAEAAAKLDHPGIVPVYEVGERYGVHYFSMALVEGNNLAAYVDDKDSRLEQRKAAEIIEQVCHAIQYAHDRAVIHRDLKPENILLDLEGRPRLTDFGLAKVLKEDEGLTMTGQVMGTPRYMAPEQATGDQKALSNRTDVYSLGATLYALLAGRAPFGADTLLQTIKQVVESTPPSLTEFAPNVSPDLQTICEKCLQKRPHDRYDSAGEMAADLRRYLDGYPIAARPMGRWKRSYLWCRRNPIVATLLSVTTATLIAATVISSLFAFITNQALHEANTNAQQLREAIKESFVFASEGILTHEPGMQTVRETFLENALQYYSQLALLTPKDRASQQEMADAEFMLGKVQATLGDTPSANASYQSARTALQRLAKQSPDNATLLSKLAKTHTELGSLAQSQLNSLPTKTSEAGNLLLEQWVEELANALRIRQRVDEIQPFQQESQRLLANAYMHLAMAKGERGVSNKRIEEVEEARKLMLQAQEIRQTTIRQLDDEPEIKRDFANGFFNLANLRSQLASLTTHENIGHELLLQSIADAQQAIDVARSLPLTAIDFDAQLELSNYFRLKANIEFQLSLLEDAESSYQRSLDIVEKLSARNSHVFHYRLRMAETYYNLCNLYFFQHHTIKGLQYLRSCRECLVEGIRIDPRQDKAGAELVSFVHAVALALAKSENYQLALEQLDQTIAPLLALIEQSPVEYSKLQIQVKSLQKAAEQIRSLQQESKASPTA
ncbi:MAG: protein kinase [Pirellulales bacterium]